MGNNSLRLSQGQLIWMVLTRFVPIVAIVPFLFFLPAGTLAYWQAWVILGIYFIPMFCILVYLLRYEPELLARRMRFREKENTQKRVISLSVFVLLAAFVLPGFDIRFGWSHVPVPVVIIADVVVFSGYMLVFLVFRENRYASRIVEVEQEQKVISTGPYAIIRHPMYAGAILMYGFSPLALGSYVAVIPALLLIPVLMARIINEESVLVRDLKGYPEYRQQVKYRLIPGIW